MRKPEIRKKGHNQSIHWWGIELIKAEEEVRLITSILKKIHQARMTGNVLDEITVRRKTSLPEVVFAKSESPVKPVKVRPGKPKSDPGVKNKESGRVKEKQKRQSEGGRAKISLNLAKVFSVRSKSSDDDPYYLLADHRATE